MQIGKINSSSSAQIAIQNKNSNVNFGAVIKTRFFQKVSEDTWKQIQDVDDIEFLAKRMVYHISDPWKNKKNRCNVIGDSLRAADRDFRTMPCVRKILNLNRWYDHCLYFITGNDAASINWSAFTLKENKTKKKQIIERHWELVRDNSKRIYNDNKEEISWNIYFEKRQNSKTNKEEYYFCGTQFMKEKFLNFPYRLRNGVINTKVI